VATSSTPPRRQQWPIIDLVELTGIFFAQSPKVRLIAAVSILSFIGVECRAR